LRIGAGESELLCCRANFEAKFIAPNAATAEGIACAKNEAEMTPSSPIKSLDKANCTG